MDVISYLLGKKAGESASGLDWKVLGYESTPQAIVDGYNYALQIQQNWVPTESLVDKFKSDKNLLYMPLVDTKISTDMGEMFLDCSNLISVPAFITSKVFSMVRMFKNCTNLRDVPVLDTSWVASWGNSFQGCNSLTNESLNNILRMCVNATEGRYSATKTLANLGLTSTYYPSTLIQSLSNYQDFLDAGWTIGY